MHKVCEKKIPKMFLATNFVYIANVMSMKDYVFQETQSVGIHDALNVQGFAMHYGGAPVA